MPVNSLSPAFVKINYTSLYATHVMTVPTVGVQTGVFAPTGYAFTLRGLASPVEVSDAVIDYVNILAPFFPATVTFVDATVYSQPTPSDVPTPVASFTLNISGTSALGGWAKATQMTETFRADDFTLFKVVMLDADEGEDWDKHTVVGAGSRLEDLRDYVTADVTFLASRGGGRPNVFLQETATLNEKLRRSYGMT